MRWDRFFEDLEDQLDSEWEAERAALDTEAERLRLARVPLRGRLVALAAAAAEARPATLIGVELSGGAGMTGRITRVGADWFAVEADARRAGAAVVPIDAVVAFAPGLETLLSSVRDAGPGTAMSQRMSFGFVLRDIVRRRTPATVQLREGRMLTGTIDRAAADHLDLALHEPGSPRRADNVTGYRIVPFAAVAAVWLDTPPALG